MRNLKFYSLTAVLLATFASCDKKESTAAPTTGTPEELPCAIPSGMKLTNHNTTGSGVDYIVSCEVEVTGGLLEIESDVTIEFKPKTALYIRENATLNARGNSDKPIVMRGQGSGATWYGVSIWSDKNSSKIAYVNITGAGSDVTFSNVLAGYTKDIKASLAIWGRVDINTLKIVGSDGVGIAIDDDAKVSFSNLDISACKDQPILTYAGLAGSNFMMDNCVFTVNGSQYIGLYSMSSNAVVDGNVSIPKASIPYLATTDLNFNGETDIAAGVTIHFENDGLMGVNSDGLMRINGTASQPVVIRGKSQIRGFWKGIMVNSNNPKNVFNHLNVADGGSSRLGLMPDKANIAVADARRAMLTLNSCTSENVDGGCQVTVSGTDGTFVNNSPQITQVCDH